MRLESPPSLADPRFHLRPLERSDVDAWYAYLSIPAVIEHTSWSIAGPDDLARIVDACSASHDETIARFAIVDGHDDSLAGTIGINQIVWRFRTAELAYDFHPIQSGRGLATACARAVTDWMLDTHDFVRMEATTLDTNGASRRVLEKAGYAHEGLMKNKKLVRGRPRDFNLFARTRAP